MTYKHYSVETSRISILKKECADGEEYEWMNILSTTKQFDKFGDAFEYYCSRVNAMENEVGFNEVGIYLIDMSMGEVIKRHEVKNND